MKNLLVLVLFSMLWCSCKTTNIYIVRHGEKATQPADNPHLTEGGKTRAARLKDLLASKKIEHVYSTNYNRTVETAAPTAAAAEVPVEKYSNDTLTLFTEKVKALGQNALIVGHSNTVLDILDRLGAEHKMQTIPDNDFSNLFIITIQKGKVKAVKETKY